jgi:hypothetical protein
MRGAFYRLALALIAALLALPVAAPTRAQEPREPWLAEVGEPTLIKLYFVRNARLAVVHRVIPMPEGKAIARATARELLVGPTTQEQAFGVETAIPAFTELVDIQLDQGARRIDVTLDDEFIALHGEAAASLRFAQVVYTLTQFRNVDRVHAAVEGGEVAEPRREPEAVTLLGRTFDRQDLETHLGPVFFETPAIGDRTARHTLDAPAPAPPADGRRTPDWVSVPLWLKD